MVAVVSVVLILATALLVGAASRYAVSRIATRWHRIGLASASAVLSMIASASVLAYTWWTYLPADADIFQKRKQVTVVIHAPNLESAPTAVRLTITFPQATTAKAETAVDLVATSSVGWVGQQYSAALSASEDVQKYSTDRCAEAEKFPPNASVACARPNGANLSWRWFVRSTEPSDFYLTIQLPGQLANTLLASTWSAKLLEDGEVVTEYVHADGRLFQGGEDRSDIREVEVVLSSMRPVAVAHRAEIDLERSRVTLSLPVKTTLGVSATTYDVLAIFALVLSGVLGSGWLWKLIAARRRPQPGDTED
jgi:hypothetical protein